MTRLPRGVGDAPLVDVETEQSGQQSNRLVLDVLRERLKVRACLTWMRMKQGRLRESGSV
jgi:hypothetical protein